jgi:hypothetical protein
VSITDEAPEGANDDSAAENPVEVLRRWSAFGATWQVVARTRSTVTVSLCRCDGGEEVQRLTSSDPQLMTFLVGRFSSAE